MTYSPSVGVPPAWGWWLVVREKGLHLKTDTPTNLIGWWSCGWLGCDRPAWSHWVGGGTGSGGGGDWLPVCWARRCYLRRSHCGHSRAAILITVVFSKFLYTIYTIHIFSCSLYTWCFFFNDTFEMWDRKHYTLHYGYTNPPYQKCTNWNLDRNVSQDFIPCEFGNRL